MKKTSIILLVFSLFAMLQVSLVNSAVADTLTPVLTVLTSDNNIPEASGPLGHQLLIKVFFTDPKRVGALGTDKMVTVSFIPSDLSLPLFSQQVVVRGGANITTNGTSTSGFYGSITYTPQGAGVFNVDFTADVDYPSMHYSRPIDIWAPQIRTTIDQNDQLNGYQVHAVYVVPSDAVDMKRDTSGQISTWLTQGARWLDTQAGDHWQYDVFNNTVDITYFHSSYPTAVLRDTRNSVSEMILKEMRNKLPLGNNRKTYLFFIETPNIITHSTDPSYANGVLCGLEVSTQMLSHQAIVATGDRSGTGSCTGFTDTMDWQAAVALHETIHTFGIEHVSTPTDLMLKIPDNAPIITLDSSHTQYFGGALAGRDIQKLPIWSKNPTANNLNWPCSYNSSTSSYYCKINNPYTIDAFNGNCWQKPNPTLVLQTRSGSKWIKAPKPDALIISITKVTGCTAKFPVSYSIFLSSTKTGVGTYRFISRGWTGKSFNIIYQN